MKLGNALPWYIERGIDVTGQGLASNGKYFGEITRYDKDFLVLRSDSDNSDKCYGSPGMMVHRDAWKEFRVVKRKG